MAAFWNDEDSAAPFEALSTEPSVLPSHVEETIREIAELRADHHRGATPMQRVVDRSVRVISRPRFVAILTAIIVAWLVLNLGSARLGYPVDPPISIFYRASAGLWQSTLRS